MIEQAFLQIEFTSYWRSGSGGSGAGDVDGAAVRDAAGLPYVPARQLKGLLLDAAKLLAATGYGGWDDRRVSLLFGQDAEKALHMSLPGVLAIRNAVLPANVREAVDLDLRKPTRERFGLARALFTRTSSTAIEHKTGAAKSKTLRSFEVAVPMSLYSSVLWSPEERQALEPGAIGEIAAVATLWPEQLDDVASLVTAVGADRSDGYGRALLKILKGHSEERGTA